MEYKEAIQFFINDSQNYFSFVNEQDLKNKKNKSSNHIYFILWSSRKNIYNWGTMSVNSDRIRKSSLLNKKLTGKYDRRVDYLMLKKIYGLENAFLFEYNNPLEKERELKTILNQNHCYFGLKGNNREDISNFIYTEFKKTDWYLKFDDMKKKKFDEFFYKIFLGKLKHPLNSKRTFYYGDCLEPKFLKTIKKEYLEPIVEEFLDVHFYNKIN